MHRLLAVLGVVALPLSAATFEARSPQHAVVVERSDGGQTEVRVTDVATNAVLLHSTLSNNHLSAKTEGDPSVSLSATETNHTLSVVMRVESRGVTTDLITGSWLVSPMAAGESAPLRVGGDIKAPIAIRRVEPVYPESARHDHVEGVVILEAVIDATGHVRNVTVLKGLPDGLAESAADALRRWVFRPATLHGEPVDVIFNVTISFSLKNQAPFPGE